MYTARTPARRSVNIPQGRVNMQSQAVKQSRALKGVVVQWHTVKKFGFIRSGDKEYHFPIRQVGRSIQPADIKDGLPVIFEPHEDAKPWATAVELDKDASPLVRVFGYVKWFNRLKGFGFLVGPNDVNYFAHHSQIVGNVDLFEDDDVQFDCLETSKGLKAINIERLTLRFEDDDDAVDWGEDEDFDPADREEEEY